MANAIDRVSRTQSLDVNRRLDFLESGYNNPKEFRVTTDNELRNLNGQFSELNGQLSELKTSFHAILELVKDLANGKKVRGEERRDPPIEVKSTGLETNNRYSSSNLDRIFDGDRVDRIECPVFDGSTSFRDWLYRCEQFLEHHRISEQSKIRKVYYRLDGDAVEWHRKFMGDKRGRTVSWNEYRHAMSLRFDDKCIREEPWGTDISLEGLDANETSEMCNLEDNDHLPLLDDRQTESIFEFTDKEFQSIELKEDCVVDLENLGIENGLKELVVKENKELCVFEDDEARLQKNEEESVVVPQALEGSMEFSQELGANAELSEILVEDEKSKPTIQEVVTMTDFEVVNYRDVSSTKGEKVVGLDGMVADVLLLNLVRIVEAVMEVCSLVFCLKRLIAMDYVSTRCQEVERDFKRYKKRTMLLFWRILPILEGKDKFERQGNKPVCLESFRRVTWDFGTRVLQIDCEGRIVALQTLPKANKCCYQVLEVMADHVWPCGIIVLLWFNNLNVSSIINCGMTCTVAWDFKKRKKSLEHLLGAKEEEDRFKSQGFHQSKLCTLNVKTIVWSNTSTNLFSDCCDLVTITRVVNGRHEFSFC